MTTARVIIKNALKEVSSYSDEATDPEANEFATGLVYLQSMLALWSKTEPKLQYTKVLENFSIVAGTSEYTIGSGQTFNTSKPERYISVYFRPTGGIQDYTIQLMDEKTYQNTSDKSTEAYPTDVWIKSGVSSDLLTFYPVPVVAGSVYILSEKQLTSPTTLDTDLGLPTFYDLALIKNLAILLARPMGWPLEASQIQEAADALKLLRQANSAIGQKVLGQDAVPTSYGFDINSGLPI